MKRLQQKALLVGLVALALGGCRTTGSDMASQSSTARSDAPISVANGDAAAAPAGSQLGDTSGSTSATGSTAATSEPMQSDSATAGTGAATGTAGTSTGTGAAATTPDQSGYTPSPMASGANSVVTLIELVPRSDMTGASGTSGSGASGTSGSGTSGSTEAGGADRVYRVTLQMDDGSTRIVTQEMAPSFRAGDRVRLENGMIQR